MATSQQPNAVTEARKADIVKRIKDYQAKQGLSVRKLAEIFGLNGGHFSQLLNRKDVEGYSIGDASWIDIETKLDKISPRLATDDLWQIRNTRTFAAVQERCKEAKENSELLGLVGGSGLGKTTALTRFTAKNANTHYVLCDVLMTQKSFLNAILTAMALDKKGTKEECMERICNELSSQEKPLLILDDFGKVRESIYPLLQLLYDRTEGRAGIMLAGVPFLKDYIVRKAQADKLGFRELKRRTDDWATLQNPSLEEIRSCVLPYPLQQGSESEIVKYLSKTIDNFGTLRKVMNKALRRATENIITLKNITDAI